MTDQKLTDAVRTILQHARDSIRPQDAPLYYTAAEAAAWNAGTQWTIESYYQIALAEARGLPTVTLPTPEEIRTPTDRRSRAKLTAARRAGVGRTLIPRDAGWKADFELSGRQAESEVYVDHVRQMMLRKLHNAVLDSGVSTTLDIIRLHAGEQEGPGRFGPAIRWTFPRAYPDTGDPARVDGGEHHGQQLEVTATWEQLALLGEDIALHFYDLAGFDAGTGEWVYRPTGQRP